MKFKFKKFPFMINGKLAKCLFIVWFQFYFPQFRLLSDWQREQVSQINLKKKKMEIVLRHEYSRSSSPRSSPERMTKKKKQRILWFDFLVISTCLGIYYRYSEWVCSPCFYSSFMATTLEPLWWAVFVNKFQQAAQLNQWNSKFLQYLVCG